MLMKAKGWKDRWHVSRQSQKLLEKLKDMVVKKKHGIQIGKTCQQPRQPHLNPLKRCLVLGLFRFNTQARDEEDEKHL